MFVVILSNGEAKQIIAGDAAPAAQAPALGTEPFVCLSKVGTVGGRQYCLSLRAGRSVPFMTVTAISI